MWDLSEVAQRPYTTPVRAAGISCTPRETPMRPRSDALLVARVHSNVCRRLGGPTVQEETQCRQISGDATPCGNAANSGHGAGGMRRHAGKANIRATSAADS